MGGLCCGKKKKAANYVDPFGPSSFGQTQQPFPPLNAPPLGPPLNQFGPLPPVAPINPMQFSRAEPVNTVMAGSIPRMPMPPQYIPPMAAPMPMPRPVEVRMEDPTPTITSYNLSVDMHQRPRGPVRQFY